MLAHRLSWEMAYGSIPEGMCVCHRCDVRNCVNPEHLFLGTRADNNRDMVAKGRHTRGEGRSSAKLKEFHIPFIRSAKSNGMETNELAWCFGVSRTAIDNVVNGKTWRHV